MLRRIRNTIRLATVSTAAWYVGFEQGKFRAAVEGAALGVQVDLPKRRRAYERARRALHFVIRKTCGHDRERVQVMVDEMFEPVESTD